MTNDKSSFCETKLCIFVVVYERLAIRDKNRNFLCCLHLYPAADNQSADEEGYLSYFFNSK